MRDRNVEGLLDASLEEVRPIDRANGTFEVCDRERHCDIPRRVTGGRSVAPHVPDRFARTPDGPFEG